MARALLTALLLAGCATATEGRPDRTARVTGAALTLRGTPWRGRPWDLPDRVTAVSVALRNDSAAPLRVCYVDLVLTDGEGRRRAALDPLFADRALRPRAIVLDGASRPGPGSRPFRRTLTALRRASLVAPPGHATWVWPWPDAPVGAVTEALLEGILDPGATVEGWLFFDRAPPGSLAWRATTPEGTLVAAPVVELH